MQMASWHGLPCEDRKPSAITNENTCCLPATYRCTYQFLYSLQHVGALRFIPSSAQPLA